MSTQYFGAVTALQFDLSSRQLFEEIVEDLDVAFRPYGLTHCNLKWCGDYIAIIKRDSLRVLLGWLPPQSEDGPSIVVLAVGHTTDGGNLLVTRETCEFVTDVLVGHLESHLKFDTVFHADATQPVDTKLLSAVAEILDRYCADSLPNSLPVFEEDGLMCTPPPTGEVLQDAVTVEHALVPAIQEINEVAKDHLNESVFTEEETSLPKRLTICALGATMLIQTPPIGATLLVYTALRGISSSPQPHRLAA